MFLAGSIWRKIAQEKLRILGLSGNNVIALQVGAIVPYLQAPRRLPIAGRSARTQLCEKCDFKVRE